MPLTSVVTRGLGRAHALLPTNGLGRVRATPSGDTHDAGYYYDQKVLDAYRKARQKEYQSREELREELKAMLREATESPREAIAQAAQSVERTLISRSASHQGKRAVLTTYVDYDRLLSDAAAALKVIDLYLAEMRRRDEDALIVLLLDS